MAVPIRPEDLPSKPGGIVAADSAIIFDDGDGVWKGTPPQIVAAATPAVLGVNGGAELVGFIQGEAGAVATTVQDKLREIISIKDYGAACDAVVDAFGVVTGTDDTAAAQTALDALIAGSIPALYVPGMCRVTDTLSLAEIEAQGGVLYGSSRGGSGFIFDMTNKPGLEVTSRFFSRYSVRDLTFTFAVLPSAGHTDACIFRLLAHDDPGPPEDSFYNNDWTNITAENYYLFIDVDTAIFWGASIAKSWFGDCIQGIIKSTDGTGKPNIRIESTYVLAPSCTGILFDLAGASITFANLEANQLNSGATIWKDTSGKCAIETVYLEIALYTTGTSYLFDGQSSICRGGLLSLSTVEVSDGANLTVFRCNELGDSHFDINLLEIVNEDLNTTGTLYVALLAATGKVCHIHQLKATLSAQLKLGDYASETPDYIVVDDWIDPTRRLFITGDVTLPYDGPHTIIALALGGNSIVTLPEHRVAQAACQLYGGWTRRIVKTDTANSLTVNDATGATVASIANGAVGVIEPYWSRSNGAGALGYFYDINP